MDPQQQASNNDSVLDWAMKEYLATKIQRQHIVNKSGADMIDNHGRYMEKLLGIAPQAGGTRITPFPAPVSYHVTQPPPQQQATPVWKQLALGAGLLGAGAALGPLGPLAVSALGQAMGIGQQTATPAPPVLLPGQGDVGIRIE